MPIEASILAEMATGFYGYMLQWEKIISTHQLQAFTQASMPLPQKMPKEKCIDNPNRNIGFGNLVALPSIEAPILEEMATGFNGCGFQWEKLEFLGDSVIVF